jgi:hypothetical protein
MTPKNICCSVYVNVLRVFTRTHTGKGSPRTIPYQKKQGAVRTKKKPVEVEVNLRPIVSRPVCLGVRRSSGTCDQFLFILQISFRQLRVCYFVAPSLTRVRVCNLLYNCFWALPERSLLGPTDAELATIFIASFETLPTWRARFPYLYPSGTGWPSYTPGYWVPFLSPVTTLRAETSYNGRQDY